MLQKLQLFISYSITQIAALVAAIITFGNAVLTRYVPAYKTCKAAGNCMATLSTLGFGGIASELLLLVCYLGLLLLGAYGVCRAYVQARRDPVGYFYSKVTSLDPKSHARQEEYNLAEIHRSGNNRLEYRGVSRPSTSRDLKFCWCARDTGVHPTTYGYRFIFRTEPGDITERPEEMRQDIANIGFVDYRMSRNRVVSAHGTFFDFTLRGDYVQRKHLSLFDAAAFMEEKDKACFDDFFENQRMPDRRRRILDLLSKVEEAFRAEAAVLLRK